MKPALNWAVEQGRLEKSPVAYMEKPPPGKRENVITPDLRRRMLAARPGPEFRGLITVCWETGCRPQFALVDFRHSFVQRTAGVDPSASPFCWVTRTRRCRPGRTPT